MLSDLNKIREFRVL